MISRRQFLKGLGVSALVTALGCNSEIFPGDTEDQPIDNQVSDYLPVSIWQEEGADLSDYGLSSAENVLCFHAPGENRFYFNYRPDRPDLPQDNVIKTNEILVAKNTVDGFEVFYRDIEQVPEIQHYAHIASNNHADLCDIIFKDNAVLINLDCELSPGILRVNVFGENLYSNAQYNERLDIQFKTDSSGISSLGQYKGLEEENEIEYVDFVPSGGVVTPIGAYDTDFTMRSGIIIKTPRPYGASDQVQLEIPSQ